MRKLCLSLLISCLISFTLFAQDATVTIPDISAQAGTEVLIPLNITNIENIGSASIRVQYDTTALTYIGIENDSFNGVIENATGGEVRTSWFSLTPVNLSGKVFDIRFLYHGGSSDLILTLVQLTNNLSQPYEVAVENGSISESAGATIKVMSPNGGEELTAGTLQNISWTSSGVTNVMIEYTDDDGSSWNIIESSAPSNGSYDWSVAHVATNKARVRVSDANDSEVNDRSDDKFTILTPPVVSDISDQTIMQGAQFTEFKLEDYATDDDGDVKDLNWIATGQSELTVTIDNKTKVKIEVPDANWNGTETITFTATDINGGTGSNTALFKVTVAHGPVVSDIPDQTVSEGESFVVVNLDDYVTDEDNIPGELTWAAAGHVELSVSIENRVATIGIPSDMWSGNETITFTATDPNGRSDNDAAKFTVTNVNNAPVVGSIPDQTIEAGESFVTVMLDEYVDDPDNALEQMSWKATGQVELNVSIINRIATISIPHVDWMGSETITFTVTDPGGLSDSDKATFDQPLVIGVEDESGIPEEFALNQNYPNPFNPSTTIRYALSVNSEVTLKVFDMAGQEVATLVNENKNAGYYNVSFDASWLSSGIYFYTVSAFGSDGSKFLSTRKMILIK